VIHIELDAPTMERTRIAVSPLWECMASLHLLARYPYEAPWPYTTWARRARRVLSATVDAPDARILATKLFDRWPDFFTPLPPSPDPTFDAELASFRGTDPDVIRAELADEYPAGLPQGLKKFRDHPRAALDRMADSLHGYWHATLAGHWPAMRSALEEEVMVRARSLAASGPDALLANLHDRIRWERPLLTVVKPPTVCGDGSGPRDYTFTASDQRLLLVPLIFSRGALICHVSDPAILAVSYQSRGAVALTDQPAPTAVATRDAPADRLVALLGRGRASVLNGLTTPNTTTGLAAELGLARSSVSEHLSGLHAAGIVRRNRVGRRVFYGLEPTGVTLVKMFGTADRLEDSATPESIPPSGDSF
jgi:DNA-binding transcriptional ArsR family regulator